VKLEEILPDIGQWSAIPSWLIVLQFPSFFMTNTGTSSLIHLITFVSTLQSILKTKFNLNLTDDYQVMFFKEVHRIES